ncbi:MAG: hypothetical protein UU23_C0001G0083 [Candidatus Curtissbacteria bacterium GW2011_GWA1_40_9]|uniref:Uncharacterized protein n=1 Tax=Candidatus Curtissbacteria bacterium GW2011_GWA1_40_9 TaxID=1618408 RepID=A0A0G0TMQ3_9BACT|nr:MAG: hypothetical protein UU23_C0001G0083 [Candidatus Curtissbacteria bacterium GW2011_GWA1_40_9]
MKRGAGAILFILISLIVLAILFATTKLIIPNQKSYEVKQKTAKDAQDAINKIQQRSIENQSIEP